MLSHTDKYGRAKPLGTRRVYKGKKAHNGRPLPFHLQVRPQRAKPTRHVIPGIGKDAPWFGAYLETLELLTAGRKIPGLLRATSRENKKNIILYTICIRRNNKTRIVYKINNKKDSCVAFGIFKALKAYHPNHTLEFYYAATP